MAKLALSKRSQVRATPSNILEAGLSHFIEGESYLRAAKILSAPYVDLPAAITRIDDWINIYRPTANLYCHTIELYLKSFLISDGLSERTLRKDYGHDILKLARECIKRSLKLSNDTMELVIALSNDYCGPPRYRYRFRYPDIDPMTIIPAANFNAACAEIRTSVYPSINQRVQKVGTPLT